MLTEIVYTTLRMKLYKMVQGRWVSPSGTFHRCFFLWSEHI